MFVFVIILFFDRSGFHSYNSMTCVQFIQNGENNNN